MKSDHEIHARLVNWGRVERKGYDWETPNPPPTSKGYKAEGIQQLGRTEIPPMADELDAEIVGAGLNRLAAVDAPAAAVLRGVYRDGRVVRKEKTLRAARRRLWRML